VQLHGSPWDEGGFSTPESQGDPTDERGWDLQLALDELVNGPTKKLSFAELVDRADKAGLLAHDEYAPDPAKLLIELKDLRKNVRHRAAEGARPWLEKEWEGGQRAPVWEYVAVLLERLVDEVERNATSRPTGRG
jgi:hypothetical protein